MNTDARGYETFELLWQDRKVEVSYQANWLNSGYWHIELRCAEHLPVTETGYRSIFVPLDTFADQAEITVFVTTWLDTAVDTPAWRKHLEESRQMTLF
tara:strand:- start:203 stop:496 length:294 start_codon:yes stop_codon:yes gene_type:complete